MDVAESEIEALLECPLNVDLIVSDVVPNRDRAGDVATE